MIDFVASLLSTILSTLRQLKCTFLFIIFLPVSYSYAIENRPFEILIGIKIYDGIVSRVVANAKPFLDLKLNVIEVEPFVFDVYAGHFATWEDAYSACRKLQALGVEIQSKFCSDSIVRERELELARPQEFLQSRRLTPAEKFELVKEINWHAYNTYKRPIINGPLYGPQKCSWESRQPPENPNFFFAYCEVNVPTNVFYGGDGSFVLSTVPWSVGLHLENSKGNILLGIPQYIEKGEHFPYRAFPLSSIYLNCRPGSI